MIQTIIRTPAREALVVQAVRLDGSTEWRLVRPDHPTKPYRTQAAALRAAQRYTDQATPSPEPF